MDYSKEYTVDNSHIDVQGIMDGLYYPFYMEDCRHEFVREMLGFDLTEEAQKGINMVLSGYSIKFARPLVKDDCFSVTCTLLADPKSKVKLHFEQTIIKDGKVMVSAVFTATCVPAQGGRPFLPDNILKKLETAPVLGG